MAQKESLCNDELLAGLLASKAVIWQCAQDRLSHMLSHVNMSYISFGL